MTAQQRTKAKRLRAWDRDKTAMPLVCIECVMAWLLFGDGAECLAGHGYVYWKPTGEMPAHAKYLRPWSPDPMDAEV